MLHLCKRLQAVLELTPRGEPVADIGCDHGRLACALLQQGAPWVTAVDISEPSLEKARCLAETLALGERMIARQGNGLEGLEPGVGAVVIAGLSAHTIRDILCRNLDTARQVGRLILQPMQDMEGLRRSLMELGFIIDAEDMVYENRRYYPMLREMCIRDRYVPLKAKGRRYWGNCPFHGEKTPSFSVSQDQQFYYCFGCHQGGNVIQFVQNIEKLEFLEALEKLADRVGMTICLLYTSKTSCWPLFMRGWAIRCASR